MTPNTVCSNTICCSHATLNTLLQETNVPDTLQPIIQAAQLLQARKTDEDVQSVCDMCDKLSMFQVSDLNRHTEAETRGIW
jgi:hypothetical protein